MKIQSAIRHERGVRRTFSASPFQALLNASATGLRSAGVALLLLPLLAASPRSATLESLPGLPFTPSAQPLGRLGLNVGLGAYGHADARLVENRSFLFDSTGIRGEEDTSVIQDLQSGTLRMNVVLGVARYLELGISVPLHFDLIADSIKASKLTGSGAGDPTLSAKTGFAAAGDHILDFGLLVSATLPTKSPKGFLPKHTGSLDAGDTAPPRFFSSYASGWSARALATLDLTRLETPIPFRAHAGAGLKNAGVGKDRLLLGGGLEWVPIPYLGFFAEAQTETRSDRVSEALGKDLFQATAGFWANSDEGMFFSAGVHRRLSKADYTTYHKPEGGGVFKYRAGAAPELALALTIGWSGMLAPQDMDKDGVPDSQDPCPNDAEDKDGFQDFDGCPERDNDEDSVSDGSDRCPLEPEDRDGIEDGDGCPDHDNDGDNIPDALDKCPHEPEDLDNIEDYDGCPDLDNDKDGVLDAQDKCPTQPEDKDGYEDADGCPDPDNDGDRILDAMDKCPAEPETQNGFEDEDGCPDLTRQREGALLPQRFVLKGVKFRAHTTELLSSSYAALDSLAANLKTSPGVMVEIRSYMDKSGSELDQFRITEAWANTVRKYLLTLGVPGNQVLARGMGSRDSIAPNTTAGNRAQNRRVEVHRLN